MLIWSAKRGRYYERVPSEQRFWKYVVKTETCWFWSGGKSKNGYGKFNPSHEQRTWEKAHRYSWKLHRGEIPKGEVVCHRCNVKLCIRPEHLYVASQQQNTLDAMVDGLCPRGETHGNAKLTEIQIKEIRAIYQPRVRTMDFLAKRYNVTKTQISRILNRKVWTHI